MAKKISTTVYITEEQQNRLKELNLRTRVPTAEFIRQGIDLVLERYRQHLTGQMHLGDLPHSRPALSDRENNNSCPESVMT